MNIKSITLEKRYENDLQTMKHSLEVRIMETQKEIFKWQGEIAGMEFSLRMVNNSLDWISQAKQDLEEDK